MSREATSDGRLQIVNYVSDKDGFRADVTYEGTPVFHEAPPGVTAPTRAPGSTLGPSQEVTTPPLPFPTCREDIAGICR